MKKNHYEDNELFFFVFQLFHYPLIMMRFVK